MKLPVLRVRSSSSSHGRWPPSLNIEHSHDNYTISPLTTCVQFRSHGNAAADSHRFHVYSDASTSHAYHSSVSVCQLVHGPQAFISLPRRGSTKIRLYARVSDGQVQDGPLQTVTVLGLGRHLVYTGWLVFFRCMLNNNLSTLNARPAHAASAAAAACPSVCGLIGRLALSGQQS